jgi:hypothetical protein
LCHIFNTHLVVVVVVVIVVVVVVGASFSAVGSRSLVWVDWDDCWTRGKMTGKVTGKMTGIHYWHEWQNAIESCSSSSSSSSNDNNKKVCIYVCMYVCMYVWHNSCGDDFLFASSKEEEASTLNEWLSSPRKQKTQFMG